MESAFKRRQTHGVYIKFVISCVCNNSQNILLSDVHQAAQLVLLREPLLSTSCMSVYIDHVTVDSSACAVGLTCYGVHSLSAVVGAL